MSGCGRAPPTFAWHVNFEIFNNLQHFLANTWPKWAACNPFQHSINFCILLLPSSPTPCDSLGCAHKFQLKSKSHEKCKNEKWETPEKWVCTKWQWLPKVGHFFRDFNCVQQVQTSVKVACVWSMGWGGGAYSSSPFWTERMRQMRSTYFRSF